MLPGDKNNKKLEKSFVASDLSDDEIRLMKDLSREPVSIDGLLEIGSWKRDRLFSLLLNLEMRDYLIKLPGNCYQAKIKLTA